jgi:hypothetical protein
MIPGCSVFHKGRVEGPKRAWPGFDSMDETLFRLIEKGAVPAREASDIGPAMSFFAVESDEGFDCQAEEISNPLDFLRLEKNAAFAVAALPAFLAFKCFHWPQTLHRHGGQAHTDNTGHSYLCSMTNYKTKRFI